MANETDVAADLRSAWAKSSAAKGGSDYSLLSEYRGVYTARSQAGLAAVVIPLSNLGQSAVGRRASGCELVAHASTHFAFLGKKWDSPAGALVCTDPDLTHTFSVLVADVLARLASEFTWQALVAAVEEWQTLLTPRGKPNAETELGLWAELWFLERSHDIARALGGWRGPTGDAVDFFIDALGAEVKASQVERQHYVSQSQVDAPTGNLATWLLSLWVKKDPGSRLTVPNLADRIVNRAPDQGDALRQLLRAGFSPGNRREYTSSYTLLSEPEWYSTADVPRVRTADPGISQLRYLAVLDKQRRANDATSGHLWQHFHGRDYSGGQ